MPLTALSSTVVLIFIRWIFLKIITCAKKPWIHKSVIISRINEGPRCVARESS
jgi:hypothetical protein